MNIKVADFLSSDSLFEQKKSWDSFQIIGDSVLSVV